MDERPSTKNVRHETLFGWIHPPREGRRSIKKTRYSGAVLPWQRQVKSMRIESWEPETTPLRKVLGTWFSKGLAKLHEVGRRQGVRGSVF